MKSKTAIGAALLAVVVTLLAPNVRAVSVTFRAFGYQYILVDGGYNYYYVYLDEESGPNLASLSLLATGSTGDCVSSPTQSKVVNLVCGKTYTMSVNGMTCGSGVSVGFSTTPPAGYLYEFTATNSGVVFDNKYTVNIRSGSPKAWKVSLKPKRVHFTVDPIPANGKARSQAQLSFLSGTSSN